LFVSLSATLRENGWTDLHEIFREGVEWSWDDLIKFRVNSGKPRDAAMLGGGVCCAAHHSLFFVLLQLKFKIKIPYFASVRLFPDYIAIICFLVFRRS